MMGASAAVASATGMRAWLAHKNFSWMTARRMRFTTVALIAAAVVGASVGLGGS